ncbi:MAG TPA: SDR family oxidoreductase [Nitrospiria bacterium]|jgi:short-subunit dehydrogenase|nr:SDR family oxidoreductase [Nitrospiria bacterium]
MSPISNQGRTALVTGASSGIGYELGRLLARDDYNLVLVARDGERLEEAAEAIRKEEPKVSIKTISTDLSEPRAAEAIIQELRKESIKIDVLINNAGYGVYGRFAETALDEEVRMMQVNMVSLTDLTKRLLPYMIQKKEGRIMNVASAGGFVPGPFFAVYYATKAYVLSLSEALNEELRGTGITVTALCPGATETKFQNRARVKNTILYKPWKMMDAGTVARIGYRGMMKGKAVVIPGLLNKLMIFSTRFGPRSSVARLTRFIQENRNTNSPFF